MCSSDLEILAFSNHIEEFKKRNVEVLGVSVDSAHTHRAWRNTKVEDGGIGAITQLQVGERIYGTMKLHQLPDATAAPL